MPRPSMTVGRLLPRRGCFQKDFTEHNGGDYTSALSCIEQIIDKCVEITDEVGNSKIGDPYNKWTA